VLPDEERRLVILQRQHPDRGGVLHNLEPDRAAVFELQRVEAQVQDLALIDGFNHAAIISTLARGTITRSPSARTASRTRTTAPDGTTCGSGGSAATLPSRPKYGARMSRIGVPISRLWCS